MTVWEHDFVIFDVNKGPKVMKEILNTYGEEGWELTSTVNVGGVKLCCWLKRRTDAPEENQESQEKEELLSLWSDKNGE